MSVSSASPPIALPLRLGTAAASVPVVLLGIWLAGGVITDDFRASMALTAGWFALVVVGAVLVWRRLPAWRAVPLVAVGTFLVVGGYLGLASVRDVRVDESVATGPALLAGRFESLGHPTTGDARIVAQGGARYLTLTGFETDPGPDLFVYVVPGPTDGRSVDGGVRLAGLKGNIGDQQYELPPGVAADGPATVVVWCRAFSVAFGAARLERA